MLYSPCIVYESIKTEYPWVYLVFDLSFCLDRHIRKYFSQNSWSLRVVKGGWKRTKLQNYKV